jgi:phosphoribosylaminoimidazole-succinocarboxamide synthase
VEVPKPNFDSKTSRWLYCTSEFSKALEKPKLLPFEWIFRLGLTEGSSFLERLRKDQKLRNKWELQGRAGERFSRPLIEVSTKHEPVDRILNLKEAVEIVGAGVSSQKWEELFEVVSLVSLYLNFRFKKMGLNLWDGKVELALDKGAEVLLVDSIGPDELRIEKDGLQLNKEYLRQIYRKTKWYEGVLRAKERAEKEGIKDWKKLFEKEFKHHSVPRLPEELKRLISQMYQSLADCISDSEDANAQKSLEELIPGLKKHLEEGL